MFVFPNKAKALILGAKPAKALSLGDPLGPGVLVSYGGLFGLSTVGEGDGVVCDYLGVYLSIRSKASTVSSSPSW